MPLPEPPAMTVPKIDDGAGGAVNRDAGGQGGALGLDHAVIRDRAAGREDDPFACGTLDDAAVRNLPAVAEINRQKGAGALYRAEIRDRAEAAGGTADCHCVPRCFDQPAGRAAPSVGDAAARHQKDPAARSSSALDHAQIDDCAGCVADLDALNSPADHPAGGVGEVAAGCQVNPAAVTAGRRDRTEIDDSARGAIDFDAVDAPFDQPSRRTALPVGDDPARSEADAVTARAGAVDRAEIGHSPGGAGHAVDGSAEIGGAVVRDVPGRGYRRRVLRRGAGEDDAVYVIAGVDFPCHVRIP